MKSHTQTVTQFIVSKTKTFVDFLDDIFFLKTDYDKDIAIIKDALNETIKNYSDEDLAKAISLYSAMIGVEMNYKKRELRLSTVYILLILASVVIIKMMIG